MTIADRATLAAGITALLVKMSGATPESVHDGSLAISEDDDAWTMPGDVDQGSISWRIFSVTPRGVDEQRRRYDPTVFPPGDTYAGPGAPLGSVIYTQSGQRRVVLEITCRVGAWDPNGAVFLRKIQDKCRLPSNLDALRAVGLALNSVGQVHDVGKDVAEDGRKVSVYVLELTCNGAISEDDDPVTTIETANFTTTVTT